MDNLSELDDCINTLEQLQLTLDFETPTVKRNPRISTSPLSPRCVKASPLTPRFTNTVSLSPKCNIASPLSLTPLDSVNNFDFVSFSQPSNEADCFMKTLPAKSSLTHKNNKPFCFLDDLQYPIKSPLTHRNNQQFGFQDEERYPSKPFLVKTDDQPFTLQDEIQHTLKSSLISRNDQQSSIQNEIQYPSSQIEMVDFQSVSVRRPKLMSNMSCDSDLFSVPEGDITDFPPPPPPLNVDNDNYLKTYSPQISHSQRSPPKNSNTVPSNNISYNTTPRNQSTNSLKLSTKPLIDPYITISNTTFNNLHSESSSQSNISNFTDKEPTIASSSPAASITAEKEDPMKQTVVRFFTTDKTTKAIVVTETMTVEQVIKILMEKHFWLPSLKSAVVEKAPSLKMERFFEENENLLNCINSWPSTCGNMIFFEPREDIYGLFENTKMYLGENYPLGSINVDAIKTLFCNITTDQHEYQDYLYIKKPGENCWKRKFCLLNHVGIFSSQKKKSKFSSPMTIMTFNDRFYLYTSTGGWTKQWDAPTPFGFAYKPYSVVDPKSDQIMMFCAGDEVSMKRWCSNLRLCKYKKQILNNYQQMQNRSTYCSNLTSSDMNISRHFSMSPAASTKSPKYNFSNRISLPTSSLNYTKTSSSKFKF